MSHRIRRADRFMANRPRPNGEEPPEDGVVQAFYASPQMGPPDGVFGASDLVGRPGVIASCTEVGSHETVYDVSCPGCGHPAALEPRTQYPITGEPGWGYRTKLTCERPIHFSGCCGWHGRLDAGKWIPIGGTREGPVKG